MFEPMRPDERRPFRDRVETAFERWARWIVRHRTVVLAGSLLLVGGLVSRLPELEVDVSDKGFLHASDPVRIAYDKFTRQFGGDATVLLALETDDVFDLEFLARLKRLHEALEEVPQVEDVTSIVNARNTYGRGDELVVEDLLEEWPRTDADLARVRKRVFANPLFRNSLVSNDARVTTLVIQLDRYSSLERVQDELAGFEETSDEVEFLTEEEELRIAKAILALTAEHAAPGFRIRHTGGPILEFWIFSRMQRDILVSVASSILLIALLLLILFRRISGVVLPLTVVILALLCAGGSMAASGVPITLPIQVLPSFLLAVGVCGAVHLLVLVYREIDAGAGREDAIAAAMHHSGLPVAMAGLTTAAGLVSFAGSPLAPVSHFGIFGPLGVLFTLVFILGPLPALLASVPLRRRRTRAPGGSASLSDRVLSGFGHAAQRYPKTIVAVTGALLAVAALGTTKLAFSHHPLKWLPEGSAVREDTYFINKALGGALDLEILLETPGIENGFQDPEVLARMDALRAEILALDVNGVIAANSISLADILKETHQALNENRAEYYRVPEDPRLVAQELLLFENSGSDDLEDFVDSRFSMASFQLRIPWLDAIETVPFMNKVEQLLRDRLGDRVRITLTGGTVIFSRTFAAVIQSMAQSYALALLIITPLMILLLGTLRGGLLSMVPNLTPILLTLGLMGWFGFDLDFSTMMIGAIVLGIAVDDTIHFMHVFQRNYRACGDPREAVARTLETTGRAILFTSIVLCIGFSGFALSPMKNLFNTGVLTCFAIAAAFLADVLLAPALMILLLPTRSASSTQSDSVAQRLVSPGRRLSR